MKRVIVLVIILTGIYIIPLTTSPLDYFFFGKYQLNSLTHKNITKIDEARKWEFMKTRLFPRGGDVVQKFSGPILISLENASEEQLAWTKEVLQEVQELIPNRKIGLFRDHTGFTPQEVIDSVSNSSVLNDLFDLYLKSISVTFGEKPSPNADYIEPVSGVYPKLRTSVLSDSTVIKRNNIRIIPQEEIIGAVISLDYSDEATLEKKKKYLKYEILRALCYIPDDGTYNIFDRSFFRGFSATRFNFDEERDVFYNTEYHPENYIVSKYDKFLLEKLYADDFKVQFKSYMTENHSKLYVYNFYHRGTVNILSKIIMIVLGAIIFLLSFSLLYNRKFKFALLNYLFPILIINVSLIALWILKNYIQLDFLSSIYLRVSKPSFVLFTIIMSTIQAILLWLVEYVLTQKSKGFVINLIFKVIFTFSSFMILYFYFGKYMIGFSEYLLLVSIVISILRGLLIYLSHYSESIIRKKDLELSQLKELQLATELNSLHAQINPHFLYNALNSIASLAKSDGNKTEKMALTLSDLFRYSVNRKGEKMTTIKEEVEMVENYLQIEKIRFEDRLDYRIRVESSIENTQIPRFVLQPLIENAIKHGVSKMEGQGCIELEIATQNNQLTISVSDNGPEFPEGLVSGHGLQSVFDLLRLSYGEQASMNWENLPKKKISITIHSNS